MNYIADLYKYQLSNNTSSENNESHELNIFDLEDFVIDFGIPYVNKTKKIYIFRNLYLEVDLQQKVYHHEDIECYLHNNILINKKQVKKIDALCFPHIQTTDYHYTCEQRIKQYTYKNFKVYQIIETYDNVDLSYISVKTNDPNILNQVIKFILFKTK